MNYRYHGSVIDLDSEDDDQKIDPIMKMNTHSSYSYSSWARDIQDPFVSNPDFASRNKKALQIYEIVQNGSSHKPIQKLARCKICFKKVVKNSQDQFQCPMCTKYCHYTCMDNPEQCPRCKFNTSTLSFNKPTRPKKFASQKKMKSSTEVVDLDSDQRIEIQEDKQAFVSTKQNVLSVQLLPEHYSSSLHDFKSKYPKYITSNGDIELPIDDRLFNSYPFLRALMVHPILPIPACQQLPYYFEDLAHIWNFFAICQNFIKSDVLPSSIQKFEQALKNKPISCFVVPLLELMLHNNAKYVNNSAWLKIFDDLKNTNSLKYLGRYFWTCILVEYLTQMKEDDDTSAAHRIQKLNLMQEKRLYELPELADKMSLLIFMIQFFQKQAVCRTLLKQVWKSCSSSQEGTLSQLNEQKQKFRVSLLKIEKDYAEVKQKFADLKTKTTDENKDEVENQLKKLTIKKQEIKKEDEFLRQEIKNIKQQQQNCQFMSQMQYSNKILFVGKDRNERCYWYITYTEAEDIIFVSQTADSPTLKNEGVKEKWGFYHCSHIQHLILALNDTGVNESRLKQKLLILKQKNFIRTSSSQKLNNVKVLRNKFRDARRDNCNEDKQIITFLENNIKDINLSQLRKLLIESERIFSNYVRKHVGIWKISNVFENRVKNEKFKNLNEIKNFIIEFSSAMYELKQNENPKDKKVGKQKRRSQLWEQRTSEYFNWKKLLQNSTRNTEVFMLVMTLYLQIVYSSNQNRVNQNRACVKTTSQSKKNNRRISSSESSESSSINSSFTTKDLKQ